MNSNRFSPFYPPTTSKTSDDWLDYKIQLRNIIGFLFPTKYICYRVIPTNHTTINQNHKRKDNFSLS